MTFPLVPSAGDPGISPQTSLIDPRQGLVDRHRRTFSMVERKQDDPKDNTEKSE